MLRKELQVEKSGENNEGYGLDKTCEVVTFGADQGKYGYDEEKKIAQAVESIDIPQEAKIYGGDDEAPGHDEHILNAVIEDGAQDFSKSQKGDRGENCQQEIIPAGIGLFSGQFGMISKEPLKIVHIHFFGKDAIDLFLALSLCDVSGNPLFRFRHNEYLPQIQMEMCRDKGLGFPDEGKGLFQ
jgi:hypothetical protein